MKQVNHARKMSWKEQELTAESNVLKQQIKRMQISHHKETEDLEKELKLKDYTISSILDSHNIEKKNIWLAGISIGLAIGIILATVTIQLFW